MSKLVTRWLPNQIIYLQSTFFFFEEFYTVGQQLFLENSPLDFHDTTGFFSDQCENLAASFSVPLLSPMLKVDIPKCSLLGLYYLVLYFPLMIISTLYIVNFYPFIYRSPFRYICILDLTPEPPDLLSQFYCYLLFGE